LYTVYSENKKENVMVELKVWERVREEKRREEKRREEKRSFHSLPAV